MTDYCQDTNDNLTLQERIIQDQIFAMERQLNQGVFIHDDSDFVLSEVLKNYPLETFEALVQHFQFDLTQHWLCFQEAVKQGYLDLVQRLVEQEGLDPLEHAKIALYGAIRYNRTDILHYFVEQGVSLNFTQIVEQPDNLSKNKSGLPYPANVYANFAFFHNAFESLVLILSYDNTRELFFNTDNMSFLLSAFNVRRLFGSQNEPSFKNIAQQFKTVNPDGFEQVFNTLLNDYDLQKPEYQAVLLDLKLEPAPVSTKNSFKI